VADARKDCTSIEPATPSVKGNSQRCYSWTRYSGIQKEVEEVKYIIEGWVGFYEGFCIDVEADSREELDKIVLEVLHDHYPSMQEWEIEMVREAEEDEQ
jgi:hypothetical protein